MSETGNEIIYYKDNAINPELVTTLAEKWANKFVPEMNKQQHGYGTPKRINSAQLRRFYGDVKSLEMRWQNSTDKQQAFRDILPLIKLLKAKAVYALNRKLIMEDFKKWIWDNVDMINGERDFKAFLLHFEAVVGFCYGNGLKDK